GEQATWLRQRLRTLAIPIKAVPDKQQIRRDLSKRIEQLILGRLMEHVQVDLAELFRDFDQQLHMTEMMITKRVDVEVSERLLMDGCVDAYDKVIEQVVQEHFAEIVQSKSDLLHELMNYVHLTRQSGRE
ncbi:MAG TPA: hypothetical protein VGL94_21685, partial [Ktedonobacteraceae bacterium]